MYRVTIINDGITTVIHSDFANSLKLEEGSITKEINKIDSFNLSFYQNNPAYGKMKPFKTLVKVLNTKTNKYEFEGRVLSPENRMDNDGLHSFSWVCEGELGYLHDSQQKHLEWRGTPEDLFIELLDYHNSQVEDYKKFEPGIVEVTTSTDNLYVYLSAESSTFKEIEDKILTRVGGELRIRKENGIKYLDVLNRVGSDKQTEIRIAKNLRSVTQRVDPTEIISRLTPLGTRVESEDDEATDASQARLTIEEVNNGVPYIDRQDLIDEFGIQGGSQTWDDITIPSRLLNVGINWLDNQKVAHTQYDISALDLSLIGLEIDDFDIGNSHVLVNPIMDIDEQVRIIGKTTNINNPQDASLKIGDKFKTLDEYQADANKSARKVIELENTVDNQQRTISTIKKEVVNVEGGLQNLKQAIENADIEGLPEAISGLEQAINDLNDALDSIPIYDVVTPANNGLMASADKVKLDLMTVSQNLNLDNIKAKLDLINVTKPIDLDQLLQDVEDLKNNN